jgi:hypothetical protein
LPPRLPASPLDAAFYAHVWCTYRAGQAHPQLAFSREFAPAAAVLSFHGSPSSYSPSSPSSSVYEYGHGGGGHGALTGSASTGSSTVVPTLPTMGHFPSQSDPSRSAYSSSSSRGGGGGGLGSRDGRSQAVLSASGNSYAVMVCTLVYTSVRVHDADVNQFRNLRPHHIRQEDGTKARISEAAWWCMPCTGRSVGDSVVGGG